MSFSIKQLLTVISLVAICIIALANAARPLVPPLMQILLFGVLASMAYGAYLLTGEGRAFRIGFLGWVIAMGIFGMTGAGNPYEFLQVLFDSASPIFEPKEFDFAPPSFNTSPMLSLSRPTPLSEYDWKESFRCVGFSIIHMIWGFIGGSVTVFVYRKRQRMLAAQAILP